LTNTFDVLVEFVNFLANPR